MTILRAGLLAAASFALLVSLPAAGQDSGQAEAGQQDAPAPDGDNIVVTGERPTHREVSRQARDITDIRGGLRRRPLARIEDRLCPGVFGLKRSGAELLIDRIRWNAERLDMWMADDADCTPNLIVGFVADGQAAITQLERDQPWLFSSLSLPERRALLAEEGPVRVWTTAETRTRDGMLIEQADGLTDPPVVQMAMAHSKIYLSTRQDIIHVVVLFDLDEVRGKSIIQLADYATMRGFARTRPADGDAALDTILALFDRDHEPPTGLTDFDQAYLRNLYEEIANLPAASKLLGVNGELDQVLAEQAAAPTAAETAAGTRE
ncbi:MAG TPA: hypothetical protein VI168_08280 [Croceibacterium sp.]